MGCWSSHEGFRHFRDAWCDTTRLEITLCPREPHDEMGRRPAALEIALVRIPERFKYLLHDKRIASHALLLISRHHFSEYKNRRNDPFGVADGDLDFVTKPPGITCVQRMREPRSGELFSAFAYAFSRDRILICGSDGHHIGQSLSFCPSPDWSPSKPSLRSSIRTELSYPQPRKNEDVSMAAARRIGSRAGHCVPSGLPGQQ